MPDQNDTDGASAGTVEQPLSPVIRAYIDEKLKDARRANDHSASKSWKRSWRSASPLTKATLLLTAGVAVATIAYAFIAAYQLGEMRHTNELTREALRKADQNSLESSRQFQVQLQHFDASLGLAQISAQQAVTQATQTANLATDTHALAGEAKTQASASDKIAANAALQSANTGSIAISTEGELNAMQTQSQLDQRAWVGVQSIKVNGTYSAPQDDASVAHTAENSPIMATFTSIEFILTNSGKTPGTIAEFSGLLEMGYVRHIGGTDVFISNGSTLGMKIPIPPKVLIPGQTAQGEFGAVQQAGTFAAFPSVRIKAVITYKDIWGKMLHTTKVCFFADGFNGTSAYAFCPDPSNTED